MERRFRVSTATSVSAVLAVFLHRQRLDGFGEIVLQALRNPAQADAIKRQSRESDQRDDQPTLVAAPRFALGGTQGVHGRVPGDVRRHWRST